MGMTYWLQTLQGRLMSRDDDDHSLMHGLADELDAACDELKIPKLSSFADFTDLELNMADEDMDDEGEDEGTVDPETGCGYGIDEMQWFDLPSGLSCLAKLRSHVAAGWNPKLEAETRGELLEELDDCIAKLRAAPAGTDKFHLAVIM
ncbi:hypothetical protein [uncultured Thiodictyon sp.]|uniref:hypothetical protein n=1 Tax=uncultured Thiodictyon sp. TaxID=1846217 RepID=UPI0025E638F3|nr:hypothetical protein [uncultured Thiodictyon sp.]